jgi:hypothetical protein
VGLPYLPPTILREQLRVNKKTSVIPGKIPRENISPMPAKAVVTQQRPFDFTKKKCKSAD